MKVVESRLLRTEMVIMWTAALFPRRPPLRASSALATMDANGNLRLVVRFATTVGLDAALAIAPREAVNAWELVPREWEVLRSERRRLTLYAARFIFKIGMARGMRSLAKELRLSADCALLAIGYKI